MGKNWAIKQVTYELVRDAVAEEVGDEDGAENDAVTSKGDGGQPAVVGVLVQGLVVRVVAEAGSRQNQHNYVDHLKNGLQFQFYSASKEKRINF